VLKFHFVTLLNEKLTCWQRIPTKDTDKGNNMTPLAVTCSILFCANFLFILINREQPSILKNDSSFVNVSEIAGARKAILIFSGTVERELYTSLLADS